MSTSIPTAVRTDEDGARRRRSVRAVGVLLATVAAAALWVVAVPVAGVDLEVTMNGTIQAIGLVSVVVVSLVVGLLGWALLAVLELRSRRAAAVWTPLALAVAVLSLAGPLTSAVGFAAGAVLVGLHVLVAAILIPMLRRGSSGR